MLALDEKLGYRCAAFSCGKLSRGTLAYDRGPVVRQSKAQRLRRWRERRPLLDEDPNERRGLWSLSQT